MKPILIYAATIKLALTNQSGIMKKVFAQTKVFSNDFDIYIWGFTNDAVIYYHDGHDTIVKRFANNRERRKFYFNGIIDFCKIHDVKAFYFRYASTDFYLLKTLRALRKSGVINVIEIPTFPYVGEFKDSLKKRLIYALDVTLRGQLKKYVQHIVTTTKGRESIFGIRCIQTTNGIDFSSIKPVTPKDGSITHMIFICSMLPHHGCDRLIKGLAVWKKLNKHDLIKVEIVGDGPMLQSYKDLANRLNISEWLTFHGMLSGAALDNVFDMANVAISSLGLHRIGLYNVSTLKSLEYVARGLPIIYATNEEVLEGKTFTLKIPSDDSPIDIDKIVSFVKEQYRHPDINHNIRQSTMAKFDMSYTMKPVISFFKEELK